MSRILIVVFLCWNTSSANTIDMTTITALTNQLDTAAAAIVLESVVSDTAAASLAAELSCYTQSSHFTTLVDGLRQQLLAEVFHDSLESVEVAFNLPPTQIDSSDASLLLGEHERLYLFISSSIPNSVLRTYIRDLDAWRDPRIIVVLRGFIGGAKYIKPTAEWIESLLLHDPSCREAHCPRYQVEIMVDPMLFTQYGITSVPAMVYVSGLRLRDPLASQGLSENILGAGIAYRMVGDVALGYFVRQLLALPSFPKEQGEHLKLLLQKTL